jgi:hypothetical protein
MEVRDSEEEEAQRFLKERLLPASEAVGAPVPLTQAQFWPVHNHMERHRRDDRGFRAWTG